MVRHKVQRNFTLQDTSEFQEFQNANPGKNLDARQTVLMYSRAIHWMSMLEILWPNFEEQEDFSVEVAYIVVNDPDDDKLPSEFYEQVRQYIVMFWTIQLEDMYPNGGWEVEIWPDPELTVYTRFER